MNFVQLENEVSRLMDSYIREYERRQNRTIPISTRYRISNVKYLEKLTSTAKLLIIVWRERINEERTFGNNKSSVFPEYFRQIVSEIGELFNERVITKDRVITLEEITFIPSDSRWDATIEFSCPVDTISAYLTEKNFQPRA